MCGISGIVAPMESTALRAGIEKMTRRMAHRGPDAEGIWSEDGIALGHRRLSIIDLSESSRQPMCDTNDRFVMVYNGEIYNYRSLRARLKKYPFSTQSDSEVVLAAYSEWGTECLQHLDGMFAFAIWDRFNRELFIARDRLGVKPLYYIEQGGMLLFASELRALIASELFPVTLNRAAICNYLMYQSAAAPSTVLEGVRQIMPGEYGVYKNGTWRRHFYWNIENSEAPDNIQDVQIVRKRVSDLLHAAVEKRMVSDVPLGAFLSGGIDSSAVVGLMAACSEQPVNTFSITFREPEFDESKYSDLISRRFNTRHHSILLRPDDFLECLPGALGAMDNPSGDGFNTYLVSRKTKEAGITVALSGIGGDELFAGYKGFIHWLKIHRQLWWKLPAALRIRLASLLYITGSSLKTERLAGLLSVSNPDISSVYPFFRQVMTPGQASQIMASPEKFTDYFQQSIENRQSNIARLPLLSQYSVAELLGYTSNVLLKDTDQMGMASALEVREPFFDHHLVKYVLQIPDSLKFPHYPKSLLVESLGALLPGEIVHRPKKGFTLPWKHWLQRELRDWCQYNLNHLASRPEFNAIQVENISRSFFQSPERKNWMPVFQMAVLGDWIARNIR